MIRMHRDSDLNENARRVHHYQRYHPWVGMLLVLLFVTCVVGCSQGLPMVPVKGKVTWQGEALESGTVTFHPEQIAVGLPKRPATGLLQPDGTFSLTTFTADDGAIEGSYQVTVHSYSSTPADSHSDTQIGKYIWAIPQRFGDPAKSGLTAEVTVDVTKEGSSDAYLFELE